MQGSREHRLHIVLSGPVGHRLLLFYACMLRMNVRQARSDDAPAIRTIAERSWETDYPDILHRENVEAAIDDWYDQQRIRAEVDSDDALVVVAEVDGEVVGFGHGIWARQTGHILRVYVDPGHRGERIGSALLESLRESLHEEGADRIQAMVLAENDVGNQFYRQAGFEKTDADETTIGEDTYTENVYVESE